MPTITDIGTLIVRSPDTCGDRPRMAGTRLTVHWVAIEIQAGVTPREIVCTVQHHPGAMENKILKSLRF